MFKGISDDIAYILVRDKIVDIDKRELYAYGIEIILLNLTIILIALGVTVISGTWLHYIAFLLIFVPLRIFSGGYHAETSTACFIISTFLYMMTVVLSEVLLKSISNWIVLIITLISVISIFVMAPVEHKNNPLGKKSKKKNRIISILLASVDSIISVLLTAFNIKAALSVMIFIILAALLMIVGKIHNIFRAE